MKIFLRSTFLICIGLLINGCGKSEVKIDTTDLEANKVNTTVALIEIKDANTGDTFGLNITDTVGQSKFCNATVVSESEVITSNDCFYSESKNKFNLDQAKVHVKTPGTANTTSYSIAEGKVLEGSNQYLLLKIASSMAVGSNLQASKGMSQYISASEVKNDLEAIALGVGTPNDKGVAKATVSKLKIKIPVLPSDIASDTISSNTPFRFGLADRTQGAETPEQDYYDSVAITFQTRRRVNIENIGFTYSGAPIFYKGNLVGLVSKAGAYESEWIPDSNFK